jgi:NAD(P)H-dependent flavin oxidoreductase YrpB (nitropropane dioxygenase family)
MSTASSSFCERLGLSVPVVQAPVGSASTARLAAAVSEAGGLGTLALSWSNIAEVRNRVRAAKALTARPIGANLVLQWPQRERLEACLDEGVEVISTFWGDPAPYGDVIKGAGAMHIHTVGSVDEARRALAAGVSAVVAQGWEAGGHVRGEVSTLALVPAVVDAVDPLPVLAAGGIGDGRGLAAVLALGAEAGWIGTRFLLATEADVHDVYREALIAAGESDTAYGVIFDGGWPEAPHRVLRNATVRRWQLAGGPPPGSRPGEGDILGVTAAGRQLLRYGDDPPLRDIDADPEQMAMYAGQSTGVIRRVESAAEIVESLASECSLVISGLAKRLGDGETVA